MKLDVSRARGARRPVTPLELFFDLVYVFAIGQLSHHLLGHVDLRTAAETAVMTLAVVYAWYMVAWGANWLDPDRLPVRLWLVGLMFASLLMSAAIPEAFGDRAWLFVVGYLLVQLVRTGFLIVALRGRALGRHFVNDLIWEIVAGALWIAGAVLDGEARLVLWTVAVAVAHAGLWVLHWLPGRGRALDLEHTGIAGDHLIERFRLFFLIALGETVLTMGAAFAGEPFGLGRQLALVIGFLTTVALWWCYFHMADQVGMAAADRAEDAGRIGWIKTWMLTLMVLGLVAIAVGLEMAIAHPDDLASSGFELLAFGGPAMFLVAQIFFFHAAVGRVPRSRPLALAALAILAVVTSRLPLIAGIAAPTAVLVAVAVADTVHRGRRRDPSTPDGALSRDDPSDVELLARARDLQLAGEALLRSLDLPGLLADVGPVRVMGSVVSGLMVWRDVDVGVLAGPGFTPLDTVRVLERLVALPGVVGFDYRDERGDRTPADHRDERYHVTIHVVDAQRDTWSLDLSVFLYDLHDHVADWHESLRDTVTAEQRRAILRIKDVWHRRPEYPDQIGGWEIYQAVLHHDVRTPDAFGAWLQSQPADRSRATA